MTNEESTAGLGVCLRDVIHDPWCLCQVQLPKLEPLRTNIVLYDVRPTMDLYTLLELVVRIL